MDPQHLCLHKAVRTLSVVGPEARIYLAWRKAHVVTGLFIANFKHTTSLKRHSQHLTVTLALAQHMHPTCEEIPIWLRITFTKGHSHTREK